LIATLKKLRDLGNTLIVVEHDEDTMREADYIVDIGPGAGKNGGHAGACGTGENLDINIFQVIFAGTFYFQITCRFASLCRHSSLVNEILCKSLTRTLNRARCIPGKHKGIEGVEQLDKVINIDQSPIGRPSH